MTDAARDLDEAIKVLLDARDILYQVDHLAEVLDDAAKGAMRDKASGMVAEAVEAILVLKL